MGPIKKAYGHLHALVTHDFVSKTRSPPDSAYDGFPRNGADFALDVAQRHLDRQMGTIDALDGKVTTLAASSLPLLGLYTAVLSLRSGNAHDGQFICLALAIAATVLIAGLTALVVRPVVWLTGPKVDAVAADYQRGTLKNMVTWRSQRSISHGLASNDIGVQAKAWAVSVTLALLIGQTVAVVLGLGLLLN